MVRWLAPFGLIWSASAYSVWILIAHTACSGICGFMQGLEAYLAITIAAAVTTIVALVELTILAGQHRRHEPIEG